MSLFDWLFGSDDPETVTTTNTTSTPLDPYIKAILNKPAYKGATLAPQSSWTQAANKAMASRALQGSPLLDQAQKLSGGILSGDFLNSNPYIDQTFNRAASALTPSINATFGAGGRTGSGAHSMAMGQGLADLATGIYGNNYNQERGYQMDALQGAPGLAAQDYFDINQLGQAGANNDAYAQAKLDDAWMRYYQPLKVVNMLAGKGGQSTTSSQPYYQPSGLSQLLGAATGIGGLLSLFG